MARGACIDRIERAAGECVVLVAGEIYSEGREIGRWGKEAERSVQA